MKNFYEVTVIDINNKLDVRVELIEHDQPNYKFTVNGLLIVSHITFSFCLLETLDFQCQVENGAVEVAKITINDKEIMPIYQHLADPATCWITGNWMFKIPGPFYPWYHEITGQGWTA